MCYIIVTFFVRESLSKQQLIELVLKMSDEKKANTRQLLSLMEDYTMWNDYMKKHESTAWYLGIRLREAQIETINCCNKIVDMDLPSNERLSLMDKKLFLSIKEQVVRRYDSQLSNPGGAPPSQK